jgi:hypothetical protein
VRPTLQQIIFWTVTASGAIVGGAIVDARPRDAAAAVFTVETTPALRAVSGSLQAVAALSTTNAWSVGNAIAHFNGTTWSAVAAVAGGGSLADVSALASDDVWAAGTLESAPLVEHWNGKTWAQVQTPPFSGQSAAFNSVLALSPTNVWGAGENVVDGVGIIPLFEQWNGKTWTVANSPSANGFIQKLAGTGARDIWAVGYTTSTIAKPLIEHFNGTEWHQVSAPFPGTGGQLYGVVALSPTNVWAVGFATLAEVGNAQQIRTSPVQTLIEHWDGQSWQIVPSPNIGTPSVFQRNALYGIAALSPTDIWTAGQFQLPDGSGSQLTLALHWSGAAWSIAPTPDVGLATAFRGVGVAQPSTVFLVGTGAFGGGLPFQSPLIATTPGG